MAAGLGGSTAADHFGQWLALAFVAPQRAVAAGVELGGGAVGCCVALPPRAAAAGAASAPGAATQPAPAGPAGVGAVASRPPAHHAPLSGARRQQRHLALHGDAERQSAAGEHASRSLGLGSHSSLGPLGLVGRSGGAPGFSAALGLAFFALGAGGIAKPAAGCGDPRLESQAAGLARGHQLGAGGG